MMSEDPTIDCSLDDLLCLQLDNEAVENSLISSQLQTHVLPSTVFDCISFVNQTEVGREAQCHSFVDTANASYSSYMSYLLGDYNFSSSSGNLNQYETQRISLQLQSNLPHDFPALRGGYSGSSIGVQAFKTKYLSDDRDAYSQQVDYPSLAVLNSNAKPVYSLAYSSPTVESDQRTIISPENMEESSDDHLLDPESPGVDSMKTQIEADSVSPSNCCGIIREDESFHQDSQLPINLDSPQIDKITQENHLELNQKAEIGKQKRQKKVEQQRYAFKTRSDTDILDDGYKWRKYGQKAVKNNSHPRSYYRCTYSKCMVKKTVERHVEDPGVVVTTYHGIHNHHCESSTERAAYPLIHLFPFRQPATTFGHSDNLLRIHS